MLRFKHHFMRIFTVLLATVFIANTVYAGSMMVSINLTQFASGDSTNHLHHHDGSGVEAQLITQQHSTANADDDIHKPISHGSCKQCNHCLACFSVLMPAILKIAVSADKPVLAMSITSLYSSPASALLQRPPIV